MWDYQYNNVKVLRIAPSCLAITAAENPVYVGWTLKEKSISPLSHTHFYRVHEFLFHFYAEAHLFFEEKKGNSESQSTETGKYISIYSGYVMFRLLWGIGRARLSVLKKNPMIVLKILIAVRLGFDKTLCPFFIVTCYCATWQLWNNLAHKNYKWATVCMNLHLNRLHLHILIIINGAW